MTLLLTTSGPLAPPQITIQEWAKQSRIVSFAVSSGQAIVGITATLTATNKKTTVSTVAAVNANAVTGLQLPPVPVGRYSLTVSATDAQGQIATANRARVEVIA